MDANIESELDAHLVAVQAIEQQSLRLLQSATALADDRQIARVYRSTPYKPKPTPARLANGFGPGRPWPPARGHISVGA